MTDDRHLPADSPRVRTLILGAAGRFGGAAAQAFAQAGWRVLAQVRPGRRAPTQAQPAIEWLPQDLHHHTALQQAAAGATVVVHALNPRRYTDAAWQREVPQLAEHAASLAQALGATLMLPGNVYGYGSQLPAQLSEHTPPQPDHTKARVRVALEQHLKDRAQQGGPRTIVIRAGDFFGAGRGSWLDLVLAKDLQRGKLTLPGPLGVPVSLLGLVMILRNSYWAKRQFIRAQRAITPEKPFFLYMCLGAQHAPHHQGMPIAP